MEAGRNEIGEARSRRRFRLPARALLAVSVATIRFAAPRHRRRGGIGGPLACLPSQPQHGHMAIGIASQPSSRRHRRRGARHRGRRAPIRGGAGECAGPDGDLRTMMGHQRRPSKGPLVACQINE